jgi:malonyl-CoA/methylmalonyl-CoA synthetase
MPSPFLRRVCSLASSGRVAIEDDRGSRSFAELLDGSLRARAVLCAGAPSLSGRRVALLMSPGAEWVEAFLGVLLAGGVAVPLSPLHPPAELTWLAADADADTLVFSEDQAPLAEPLAPGRRLLRSGDLAAGSPQEGGAIEAIRPGDTALLLYTSGTTGKPKGAMLTHENLAVHAELLRDAWGLTDRDALLHALPLHHLHGLGISLLSCLLAGAAIRMLPRFDARRVWEEMALGRATVWMAVPTMYQKLFEALDVADEPTRARWGEGARSLRLSTSGSSALPVTLAERWRALTGAIPLERFGMTEIGVGMSNPLAPEGRRAGTVGHALPTVEARLIDDGGQDSETGPGELWVRGPSVFGAYWGRAEVTAAAFTDGWFRTGDVAERSPEGYVKLLGRTSVDILKSGGYKLSALEIEEALRESPAVAEVAVVGIPDSTWGDRVVAVVVPRAGRAAECTAEPLRAWLKDRLAPYKVPREVIVVPALPRNAVGKVVKPDLIKAIAAGELRDGAP